GVITDIVQQGGYFPDPVSYEPDTALSATGPFALGQPFFGTYAPSPAPDELRVRFRIRQINGTVVDGILCDGSTNWAFGPDQEYINRFTVVPPVPGGAPGQLQCSVNAAAARTIVDGVVDMKILYGVKRSVSSDYNVDTYLRADQMVNNGSG